MRDLLHFQQHHVYLINPLKILFAWRILSSQIHAGLQCNFDIMSGDIELHSVFLVGCQTSCLRWFGGMDKDSVLSQQCGAPPLLPVLTAERLTCCRSCGFAGFPPQLTSSPARESVERGFASAFGIDVVEKEIIFEFKIPRGLCRYFCVVTRDKVDSCISTALGRDNRPVPSVSYILALFKKRLLLLDDAATDAAACRYGLAAFYHHFASCKLLRFNRRRHRCARYCTWRHSAAFANHISFSAPSSDRYACVPAHPYTVPGSPV